MSRRRLAGLVLLGLMVSNMVIQAQSESIVKRFEVTAPYGYEPGAFVSWSPDSTLVALSFILHQDASQHRFERRWQVYDAQTGELVNECRDLIAWTAGSARLIVRRETNAPPQILDAHTGALLGTLNDAGNTFAEDLVRVSPPLVLVGDVIPNLDQSTNTLRFHAVPTGELLQTLNGVFGLPVYTHDRTRFAVNTATGVQVYEAKSYTLRYTLDGFAVLPAYQSPWSLDDRHVLVKPQQTDTQLGPLHIWTPDGNLSAPIYNATGMKMAWSPDSLTVAVPSDYTKIRLYDAGSGELVETIHGFSEGEIYINAWQADYLIATSGNYRFMGFVLNVWDTTTHTFLFQGNIDLGSVSHIQANILQIYEPFMGLHAIDLTTGQAVQEVTFDQMLPYRSPDGRWLIGGDFPADNEVSAPVYVYQAEPFELVATLQGHSDIVRYVEWAPDSRHFASVGLNNVIVWELAED